MQNTADARTAFAFTDGSKLRDHYGSGALVSLPTVPDAQTRHQLRLSQPLGSHQTVYAAELAAIRLALDSIAHAQLPPLRHIYIFADNQAALRRALDLAATPGQQVAADITSLVSKIHGHHPEATLTLVWVPAHSSQASNEAADKAARAAACLSLADMQDYTDREAQRDYSRDQGLPDTGRTALADCLNIPFWSASTLSAPLASLTTACSQIREDCLRLWSRRWQTSGSARLLKDVATTCPQSASPGVHEHLTRAESSVLTQLRTGRSELNETQYQFHRASTDRCACGARETRAHFLLTCPLYRSARTKLRQRVGSRLATDLPSLLSQPPHIYATLEFVASTGRFPRYRFPPDVTDKRIEEFKSKRQRP